MSYPDKRSYSNQRNIQIEFHAEKLPSSELGSILRFYFKEVSAVCFRIAYG